MTQEVSKHIKKEGENNDNGVRDIRHEEGALIMQSGNAAILHRCREG